MFNDDYIDHPADNTPAVVTLAAMAAGAVESRYIRKITWSYDDDPTGGSLTITDGGTTVFKVDITGKGVGFIDFDFGEIASSPQNAVVVTLAAGGAGIAGKLNVSVAEIDR